MTHAIPQQIEPDQYGAALEAGALWSFETARYTVALFALEEDTSPSDSFEFPEDIAFASDGEPAHWFCAAVAVYAENGEQISVEYLGGCSYRSFREFYSSHRCSDPENRNTLAMKARNTVICHYFPYMVREAVNAARVHVAMQSEGCRRA